MMSWSKSWRRSTRKTYPHVHKHLGASTNSSRGTMAYTKHNTSKTLYVYQITKKIHLALIQARMTLVERLSTQSQIGYRNFKEWSDVAGYLNQLVTLWRYEGRIYAKDIHWRCVSEMSSNLLPPRWIVLSPWHQRINSTTLKIKN